MLLRGGQLGLQRGLLAARSAACARAEISAFCARGERGGGLLLERAGLGQGGARDLLGRGGLLLQDGDLVEDVGAVAAGRLEQGGALDQLARVGRGDERRGAGVGAALHVAAAGEGDDLGPGDTEVGGRLRGRGGGGVGALLGVLVGRLLGLVVVERERRPGVRVVDGGLGPASWPESVPDGSATASAARLGGRDLGVAEGRRRPRRDGVSPTARATATAVPADRAQCASERTGVLRVPLSTFRPPARRAPGGAAPLDTTAPGRAPL